MEAGFMFFLEIEGASFTFRAFGETEAKARGAMAIMWARHVKETDADPDYLDPKEDGNVWEVQPGEAYRDDQLMVANGIPVKEGK